MKKLLLFILFLLILDDYKSQVGINNTSPATTLQIDGNTPSTKPEGILIPRFTGDEIFNMPVPAGTALESNLVYAKSAASVANRVGVGINLLGKGFYYWDGNLWTTMVNATTNNNFYTAYIKPMNTLLADNTDYPYPTKSITVPSATKLVLFDANFTTGSADFIIDNNPLSDAPNNFVIWDNTLHQINVPQQLLGYAITINISLKYPETTSNSDASRFVAYTGNAVYSAASGTVTGGTKIKDLMFKKTKTSGFTTVRDELVLSPVIITQEIITNGIRLYLGSGDSTVLKFYEPILTIDYGVVNTTL